MKNDKNETSLTFTDSINSATKLNELLTHTEKMQMVIFDIRTEADLMRAQAVFIELGEHMLEFCDFVNQFLREIYYQILVTVLQRNELDLDHLLISPEDQKKKKNLASKKALVTAY